MAELDLAYRVRSYSTGTLGRAISNARNHHWVADDSGGEELGAGEFFLSGISACAVDPDAEPGDVTLYEDVRVHFQMWGVSDDDGQRLVDIWKQR